MYESLPSTTAEQVGTEVVRTQWLDFSTLGAAGAAGMLGKKILIVDEVDDTCVLEEICLKSRGADGPLVFLGAIKPQDARVRCRRASEGH